MHETDLSGPVRERVRVCQVHGRGSQSLLDPHHIKTDKDNLNNEHKCLHAQTSNVKQGKNYFGAAGQQMWRKNKDRKVPRQKNSTDLILKMSQVDDIFFLNVELCYDSLSGRWVKRANHNSASRGWKGGDPLCFLEINMSERLSDTGQTCLCAHNTSECAKENKACLSPRSQKQVSASIVMCYT